MRLNFQPFFLFSFCMHKFISCTIVITNLKRICDNNTYLIDLKISPITFGGSYYEIFYKR